MKVVLEGRYNDQGTVTTTIFFFFHRLFCATILLSAGQAQDAQEVFESLVQDAFAGDDLLLILDGGAKDKLDVKAAANSSGSVLLLASDNSSYFLQRTPRHLVRGSHFTALLVFTASVVPFMETLDTKWNPNFMLLMSLNSSVNSTALLVDERFQRSQHLALVEPDNRAQRTRFMVYSSLPMKGRFAVKSSLGEWGRGSFRRKQDYFPERFNTLHGAVLQLGSWCDDFPFLYPEHGLCKGSSLDMLDLIAGHLNFSYDVQMEPDDHKWGSLEEGQWTGMLGDLAYNNKDLVINVFQMTLEIFADFEVSYPYHVESYVFLLAVPEPAPQWQGLLYPFTATVWLAILGTITVVTVLLNLCLKAVPDTQDDSQVFLLVSARTVYN
ncbi:Glutamate receptor ionotropic, delta-2 [Portunus trituberculatus]|uniref:Glutamate receptor ionotropic, delta-2 n=1 Tax=Portunus trituberculatus TaxID=210409 RepID=A0A5B7IQN9_PORTR|nr:Glutamate receptor ionotropic, delta-2 [Portunus trituberculatus]